MRSTVIAVLAFATLVARLFALQADDSQLSQQVDRIFAEYDHASTPGCSLGVIRDGRFVYRKSYGAASLELGVPLSSHSVFYAGSISKQFTAASVVLAAEQGFLSLDDDVRKYIPELPDYGHTITLRQMLHQTSGLRDLFELLYFSGLNATDFNSAAEILKLIERQKGLNNVPGDEWVYSNTNYFLVGVVLERATKKTLAEFAAENIFEPLGMTHTRFYEDASVVVPERVAAYDPDQSGQFLVDWSTSYALVGGGGLMTSVDDLLAWDNNFYANRLGKGTLLKELETPGMLNDGQPTFYGMGLMLRNYRGLATVEHNGVLFGYRTDILRFRGQKFTVVCLCNVSNADPESRAHKVADLFLNDEMQADATVSQAGSQLPDPSAFAGQYLDPHRHAINSFTAANGSLHLGSVSILERKSANQFYDSSGDVVTFEASNGVMQASLTVNGELYFSGSKLTEFHAEPTTLREFAGLYRSEESTGTMVLSLEDGSLTLRNGGNPPLKLTPIAKDEFTAAGSYLIEFHRDKPGQVSGLSISEQAARGLAFNRIRSSSPGRAGAELPGSEK